MSSALMTVSRGVYALQDAIMHAMPLAMADVALFFGVLEGVAELLNCLAARLREWVSYRHT